MRVEGNPSIVRGINGQRLKRAGGEQRGSGGALREAHRLLFVVKMPIEQAATLLDESGHLTHEVLLLLRVWKASTRESGSRPGASEGDVTPSAREISDSAGPAYSL